MDPGNVTFVLHRPSSAENIGSVARVLKNFGLSRLCIVAPPSWAGAPRGGGDRTAREEVLLRARRTARRAVDVLEAASIHVNARDALAGAIWTCGTTSRHLPGRPRLTPRELAAEVRARSARGPVAIVFGEERRGLSDRELDLCQALCTIPTGAAYDSMNLAQACAVVAYELAVESAEPAAGRAVEGPPARHETMEALWSQLERVLGAAGYLNPQNPHHILAEWRQLLARAEPSQRDAELLVAAARAIARRLRIEAGEGR